MRLRERVGQWLMRSSPERPSTNLSDPSSWLVDAWAGTPSASGMTVNEETALRLTAVFACVRVIAETVGSLPLFVYRRDSDDSRGRAQDHPLYSLLHDQPNPFMTSAVWRETMQAHAATRGNAYSLIEWGNNGWPAALWPIPPNAVTPAVIDRRLYFKIDDSLKDWGIKAGAYDSGDILHIPGMGFDGISGYSPIRLAREAIGLAAAAETQSSRFFANGSRPGGILTSDGSLSPDARKQVSETWESLHRGAHNSNRIAVLGGGLKYQAIGISPEDAQFLESRKFQVEEIARLFRVPLHLIQHTEPTTSWGTGIEHMSIGFVTHTIRPWLVRWEQEFGRKLFTPRERRNHFVEFAVEGLLRGDITSRFTAYNTGITAGFMTRNEARTFENLNAIDGLDEPLIPLNMGTREQVNASDQDEEVEA